MPNIFLHILVVFLGPLVPSKYVVRQFATERISHADA